MPRAATGPLRYKVADLVRENLRAVATTEFRPPKAGEWYLSGAIVCAWRAPNDLSTPYRIARLVRGDKRSSS